MAISSQRLSTEAITHQHLPPFISAHGPAFRVGSLSGGPPLAGSARDPLVPDQGSLLVAVGLCTLMQPSGGDRLRVENHEMKEMDWYLCA